MKLTNFLKLKKPESTDYVQIEDLNENMDLLDDKVKALSETPAPHTHTKSQITDFPMSMPASDVYSWAKAASKPTYTASEVGARPNTWTPSASDIGLTTETWTFTLEDGSTVTKAVYVG